MNSNLVADLIGSKIKEVTSLTRVYRNEAPAKPTFPYVVFDIDTVNDSYPSNDYILYVTVYDKHDTKVRAINDIADLIDNIDNTVINDEGLNMFIKKVLRQFISANELTKSKAINLQYDARVYFK